MEYSNTLAISTFLDPRFKQFAFKNNDAVDKIKKVITTALTEMINVENENRQSEHVPVPSTSSASPDSPVPVLSEKKPEKNKGKYSVWDSLDKNVLQNKPRPTSASSKAIIELQRYLEDEVIGRNENPLDWWRKSAHNYPYLSRLVRARCCALATSVPCERLFSKAGIILNERRRSLSAKKLKYLLFINVNISF